MGEKIENMNLSLILLLFRLDRREAMDFASTKPVPAATTAPDPVPPMPSDAGGAAGAPHPPIALAAAIDHVARQRASYQKGLARLLVDPTSRKALRRVTALVPRKSSHLRDDTGVPPTASHSTECFNYGPCDLCRRIGLVVRVLGVSNADEFVHY